MARTGRPKKDKRAEETKAVLVRMPAMLKLRLDADSRDVSLSDWIIDAIRQKLDRFEISGLPPAVGRPVSALSPLWQKLRKSKRYREEFAAAQVKRSIPLQLRKLMKQYELSQTQLAERAHLTQGVVSRAADPEYGNLTINTITRLAAGLDVAFIGRFVPFSELHRWFDSFTEDSLSVMAFVAEDAELQSKVVDRNTPDGPSIWPEHLPLDEPEDPQEKWYHKCRDQFPQQTKQAELQSRQFKGKDQWGQMTWEQRYERLLAFRDAGDSGMV